MTDRLSPAILEIKRASVNLDAGTFTGYASTFGYPADSHGDIVRQGAFAGALAAHRKNDSRVAMLWAHDHSEVVGKWLALEEDSYGLLATGQIITATKRGTEALALLEADCLGLSIGFVAGKTEVKNGIREIIEVARLGEISLVACPANSRAKIQKPETVRAFQKAMQSMGFTNTEARNIVTRGFRDTLAPGERSEIDLLNLKIDKLTHLIESKFL